MARAVSSFGGFGAVGRPRDIAPMMEINTTPLIDVMLVLLIMFIITVPTQTHEASIDLPNGPPPIDLPVRLKNDLVMDQAGRMSWNGQAVSDRQLAAVLGGIAPLADQPEIHFRPDPAARYARVDQVLGMAARSGVSRFGFAGNEQYHDAI